jgi:hypothetical protein
MQVAEQRPNDMLVRIKPDKRGVFRIKRYMFEGSLYLAAKGWYLVNPETAELLKELRHNDLDSDSQKLFDVCTRDEATKLEEDEAEQVERATAGRPHRMNAVENRKRIDANGLPTNAGGGNIGIADLDPKNRTDDGQMIDPDPEGTELRMQAETQQGVVPVGRVSEREARSAEAQRRIQQRVRELTESGIPSDTTVKETTADSTTGDHAAILDEHGNPTNKVASQQRSRHPKK